MNRDELHCDGAYCRRTVDPGAGIQLALPGEDEQRLCIRCYVKWERERFPLSYEEGMP